MLIILLDEQNVTNVIYLVLMHQEIAVTVEVDMLEHLEVGIEDVVAALLMVVAVMVMTIEAMEVEVIATVIAHMVMIKDMEDRTNKTIDKIVGIILDIVLIKIFGEVMRIFTGFSNLIFECMLCFFFSL